MPAPAFDGAKVALLCHGAVLTLLRDARPDIPFPGHWDLPGGGREGNETPEVCVLRELREEFGLSLTVSRLRWSRCYLSESGGLPTWFFGGHVTRSEISGIRFGDEGQGWQLMPVEAFVGHDRAVPHLQSRLRDWLNPPEPRL